MASKTYEFDLKFKVTLNDNDEEWNVLPPELPDGLAETIANEFSHVEDYYDGFTDMIIEACGCDVEKYEVTVQESDED
jgi:hypothetical protein